MFCVPLKYKNTFRLWFYTLIYFRGIYNTYCAIHELISYIIYVFMNVDNKRKKNKHNDSSNKFV